MRYIDRKRVPVPKILSSQPVRNELERIDELLRLPEKQLLQRRAKVETKVTLHPEVRGALDKLFSDKCAYCESSFRDVGAGDVNHFRPKTSAIQLDKKTSPHHYFWLSLDWHNLYLSCYDCSRAKGQRFPVTGTRAALGTPIPEIYQRELGTMVDPCVDFPTQHLTYDWSGRCYPLSERGQVTIEVLNLNRRQLVDARRDSFGYFGSITSASRLLQISKQPYIGAFESLVRRAFGVDHRQPYRAGETISLLKRAQTKQLRLIFDDRKLPPLRKTRGAARGAHVTKSPAQAPQRFPLMSRVAGELPLHRIEIRNFKGIAELSLQVPKPKGADASCLMLLGENATGKTTVLEAITLSALGCEGILNLDLEPLDYGAKSIGKLWLSTPKRALDVTLSFLDREQPVRLSLPAGRKRFKGPTAPATVVLAYGPRRYFSPLRRKRLVAPWRQVQTLFDPLATIPHPDLWLQTIDLPTFDTVVRALREVLLLDDEATIGRHNDGRIFITAQGRMIPLDNLSEGFRSIVALSVDIMRELLTHWDALETAKGLVLIDEIETHLHPRWKMRIMSALRKAFPCVQFIVTTHDPLCLRGMEKGEVAVLHRTADGMIELLDDLPNIKGMRVDQLLTSGYFGLSSTTDPELEDALSEYGRLLSAHPPLGSKEHRRKDELEKRIDELIVVGDTPIDRVMHEATGIRLAQSAAKVKTSLRNFMRLRSDGTNAERKTARREAVASVVKMLNLQGEVGETRKARASSERADKKGRSRTTRV